MSLAQKTGPVTEVSSGDLPPKKGGARKNSAWVGDGAASAAGSISSSMPSAFPSSSS